MNAIVEARIVTYLRNVLRYEPLECSTILRCIRELARAAGHGLDERFGHAGLGAGPDCRVASGIVDLAMGGGGCATSETAIKACISNWLRTRALSV